MKDLGRIRRLFYRDGVSLSEISRKTGYSRNTVKRWLKTPEGTEPKYRRLNPNTKIAPYAAQLIKALETDARRPKRDRRSALKLFGELQAAGLHRRLLPGHRIHPALAKRRWHGGQQSLCAVALRTGRSLPVRLERRTPGHRRRLAQDTGVAPEALRQPGLRRASLPDAGPRNAVRRPHARLCRPGRHSPARHLRQHEDGRGQGQERQGPHRQFTLCRDGLALPVRSRLLQCRQRLGERRRREECPG